MNFDLLPKIDPSLPNIPTHCWKERRYRYLHSIGDTTQSSKLRNGLSTFRLFHSADSQLLGLTELSCCICRCCLLNSVVLIDSIVLTSYSTMKIPWFHKLPPFSSISLTVLISCEPIRPGRGQPGCQGQHWMSHGPN